MVNEFVAPEGKLDAPVVVLGEVPGKVEMVEGQPFVGPAGRLLFDSFFARAGIRRSQCLILNVHWKQPPGNKWESIPKDELGVFDARTMEIICRHERSVIIAVGGHALDFLFHGTSKVPKNTQSSITKWRGSLLQTSLYFESTLHKLLPKPCVVVPIIHPAAVLRSGSYDAATTEDTNERKGLHYRALCQHDAHRIAQVIEGELTGPPERSILHAGNSEPGDLIQELTNMKNRLNPIAFDIETFAKTITCIGVADSSDFGIVVPLTQLPYWTLRERASVIKAIGEVLDCPAPKIGQNLDYDVQYLARFGLPVRNVWLDTALAHQILYPEMPHDLALLASIYTTQPYYKDMRKEVATDEYEETQWVYNGIDCCVTWEVGTKVNTEIGDWDG